MKSGRPIQFHNEDQEIVKKVSGVGVSSGRYFMGIPGIPTKKNQVNIPQLPASLSWEWVENLIINEGRFINQIDILQNEKVIVLGADIKKAPVKTQRTGWICKHKQSAL